MQTEVKHYTDYRSYLLSHVQERRSNRATWSLGGWAKKLGLKSTSSISKVISGQRLPGPALTEKLVNYFEFSDSDAEYFRDLVKFHKVKNDPQLSLALLEKIGKKHPDGSLKILDFESFSIISNWYGLAVREMMRNNFFFQNPEWLSEVFEFEVSSTGINDCIQDLLKCKLIETDEHGLYQVTSERIASENDISREAIKRYHEGTLELAKKAVRKFSVKEREFQATTFCIEKENLEKAKTYIRRFRQEFTRLFEETSGNQICQLQIQLFPLSKEIERKKA